MTMFNKILQVFAEKSPVTVMVHGLLERFLNAEKIDEWFDSVSEVQYTLDSAVFLKTSWDLVTLRSGNQVKA